MLSEEYRRLKVGDRLRLARWNGYHGNHFKQNGVYVIRERGENRFLFAKCEFSEDRRCATKCSGSWSMYQDWEYAYPEEPPVTPDEAARAVPLPPVEDVARYFGVKP